MMQRTLEEVRTRCEREEHSAKALRTRVREVEWAYNDLYHSADNREERSHRERRMLQDVRNDYMSRWFRFDVDKGQSNLCRFSLCLLSANKCKARYQARSLSWLPEISTWPSI